MSRTPCEVCRVQTATIESKDTRMVCALCERRLGADKRIAGAQMAVEAARTTQEATYAVAAILEAKDLIPKELYALTDNEISVYPTDGRQAIKIAGLLGSLINPKFEWWKGKDRFPADGEMMAGESVMFLSRGTWKGRILIRAIPPSVTPESVADSKGPNCISCHHNVNAWSGSCSCPCHVPAMKAVGDEHGKEIKRGS